jgi:hypothetical protein
MTPAASSSRSTLKLSCDKALGRYRITNLIHDRLPVIRSMKRQTDAPFKQPMRFFTPELYLRFNSRDDEIADLANEEWEKALGAYEVQLSGIQDKLPEQPRRLAELSLHDYELLGWDDATQPDLRPAGVPIPAWSAVTVLSLRQRDLVVSLNYVLWDIVRRYPAPNNWPFSKLRLHWLYDEVDLAPGEPGRFLHRILFSDGTTAEVPFAMVFIHSVPLDGPGDSAEREAASAGTSNDRR